MNDHSVLRDPPASQLCEHMHGGRGAHDPSTLDRVDSAGRSLTERRGNDGGVEWVFTIFDSALRSIWLFEAGCGRRSLILGARDVVEQCEMSGHSPRWTFSPEVEDSPPDCDTTATGLLLLEICRKEGVQVPSWTDCRELESAFAAVQTPGGGVRTFLSDRRNNLVDPVVNACVAEWLMRSGRRGALRDGVLGFVDGYLRDRRWRRAEGSFYRGFAFFGLRAARLWSLDGSCLSDIAIQGLDELLLECAPENALDAAFLFEASGRRGLRLRVNELQPVVQAMLRNGQASSFQPFYRQRTPAYTYGSPLFTFAATLNALRVCAGEGIRLC